MGRIRICQLTLQPQVLFAASHAVVAVGVALCIEVHDVPVTHVVAVPSLAVTSASRLEGSSQITEVVEVTTRSRNAKLVIAQPRMRNVLKPSPGRIVRGHKV